MYTQKIFFIFTITFALLATSFCGDVIAAPTPRLQQSDARLRAIETQLNELVNHERASQHLPLLVYDSTLAEVARAHSAEMRDEKYFSHQSPTPSLEWPLDRYQKGFNTTPRLVAENIYRQWTSARGIPANAAAKAHQSFMNSPGHKANILLPNATRLGIGVVSNDKGDLWITEMFAHP